MVYILFGGRFPPLLQPSNKSSKEHIEAISESSPTCSSLNKKTRRESANANRYSPSHKEIATFISKHEIYLILVTTQAYCVKCKAKRDMKNEKQVTMKNGRQALSGTCSVCGTKMFKIGGSSSAGSAVAKQRPKVKAASKKPAGRTTKAKSKTKAKKSKSKSKK